MNASANQVLWSARRHEKSPPKWEALRPAQLAFKQLVFEFFDLHVQLEVRVVAAAAAVLFGVDVVLGGAGARRQVLAFCPERFDVGLNSFDDVHGSPVQLSGKKKRPEASGALGL